MYLTKKPKLLLRINTLIHLKFSQVANTDLLLCIRNRGITINIYIRELQIKDLDDYFILNHPSQEHYNFNNPFLERTTLEELKSCIVRIRQRLENNEQPYKSLRMIANADNDKIVGEVSWYWKSKETLWLEVGIIIYDKNYWGKGIATIALKKWISQVFELHPEIVRIGLTTWSGNIGMCKVSEKIGLKQEACYRNSIIVNDKFYDSISYGILRDEWIIKN